MVQFAFLLLYITWPKLRSISKLPTDRISCQVLSPVSTSTTKQQIVVAPINEPLKYTDLVIAVGRVGPILGKRFVQTAVQPATKYSELENEVHKNLYAHHSLRILATISFYTAGFLFCLRLPQISQALNVVILGGGAVVVELAEEIADRYREKDITIVHSRNTLVTSNFEDKLPSTIKIRLNQAHRISTLLGM